jgi:hypothetical protein
VAVLALPSAAFAQDTTPPVITISRPAPGAVIHILSGGKSTPVSGRVVDADSGVASVTVNGHKVEPSPSGSFFYDLPTRVGVNTVAVTAVDTEGNAATKKVRFTYRPSTAGGGSRSANVLTDARGDAHGSPVDLRRATRKKNSRSWIVRIEFWKPVALQALYYHGGASGNLSLTQGGSTWFVSGNCAGRCVEAGPGKRGGLSRPDARTVIFTIPLRYLRSAPWGVFASFGGTARCPRTGTTPEDTPCKDNMR